MEVSGIIIVIVITIVFIGTGYLINKYKDNIKNYFKKSTEVERLLNK